MSLIAQGVSKRIKDKQILRDVSLDMKPGAVYGFCGRNGSGKTMLFRALSGLMRIDSGKIYWKGQELHKDFSVLPSLGIVLEHAGLYPNMTGLENLSYLAGLKGIIGKDEMCEALERVGLEPYDKRVYGKYSMGMKQRIAIAQAIMERPDVIMLDEPTNGLDEAGVQEIRALIGQERKRGALILLASHNKEDMNLLADCVYQIADGCLKGKGVDQ
ncbi:MAG: ATP-binding cassette domain-containing protein [Lachnospiraceae bacterium]|nr:ATP-binding cassette domain-containing protein [Lachnospiraceae bacterium]MBD5483763.1 ATP-binding cassette domain-containing protein [Lachnospiraceae bacterium]